MHLSKSAYFYPFSRRSSHLSFLLMTFICTSYSLPFVVPIDSRAAHVSTIWSSQFEDESEFPKCNSQRSMMSRISKRSDLLFITFLLDLFGLGLRGRRLIHWFFFTLVIIQTSWRLYGSFTNFKFYLVNIADLSFNFCSLLQIFLSIKRVKLLRQLLSNLHKLNRRNHLIVRVVDAIICFLVISQFAFDMYDFVWTTCYDLFHRQYSYLDRSSNLVNITIATVCIHRSILIRYSDMFCGLYLLIFVVIYLIKVQHLAGISNSRPSEWKVKVWAVSSHVSSLQDKFEDSSSIILFDRTVYQFLSILALFQFLMENIRTKSTLGLRGIIFATCGYSQNIFITVSVLLSISLMQEDIDGRCKNVTEQIMFTALSGGSVEEKWISQKILKSNFTQKVTIGKMVQVSRSIIISLASSYVVFSILFWQINNGGI